MKDLTLEPHQFKIIEQIMTDSRKKLVVPMDTGTGKTITGLTVLRLLEAENKRTLIVAPPILIQNAWVADNDDFAAFQLPITQLDKQSIESEIFNKPGIYITSYSMVLRYKTHFQKYSWDIIMLDESHKIANRNSKISQTFAGGWCKALKKKVTGLVCDRAYLLTGTMIPNNEEQILQQIRMCGYRESWTYFKNMFFDSPVPTHPYIIKFRESMREQFNQLVAKYTTSVVTKADTSLNDIEKEYNIIRFNPSEKVVDVQKAIIKDSIVKLDDKTITIDYVISSISKLRQVSRGFILDNNKNVSKLSNTPYKMFEEFINDRASRTPYIVWYCYNYEIQELVKTLEPSIKRWVLNGGLSKNAQTEMIQGFKASDSGVMFIQYGVGKNGLTLTNCHNMVFFSLEDNNESFTQAQDRIHRIGQKEKKVNYYIFQCRGTIDEQIYQSLINKNNMLESLKAWIRSNKDV